MTGNGLPRDDQLGRAWPTRLVGRRAFLGLAGGAALSPRVGRAQRPFPIIGFLYDGSPAFARPLVDALWQSLDRAGYVENKNIAAAYRWGEGHDDRLTALAADLCRQDISILIAGGARSVAAARQATATIPIVFVAAANPAGSGFGAERPEFNMTGVDLSAPELLAERFQTLLKIVPDLRSTALLINPQAVNIGVQLQYVSDEAKRRGIYVQRLDATGETDFAAALKELTQRRQDALLVANDAFLNGGRDRLVAVTRANKLPAAFANRQFVEAGGLMSYGPSAIEAYEQAGAYAGRILKGEKPADLSIQHPLEMELALNAQVAKALGLDIPPALRAAASEVIG